MFLLTASEVVLGTAIIMGLSALITVLLRVCARPRYVRNSLETSNVPEEFGRTGMRVSLTSLQQRVMSKLRDRPPRYETRHNYEYQRREISNRIAVLNPGAMFVPNVPPPTYELSDNSTVRIHTFNLKVLRLNRNNFDYFFMSLRLMNFLQPIQSLFRTLVGY